MLTEEQLRLLYTCGAEKLRELVNAGDLPDCVEVNSTIAERCLWACGPMWEQGQWFHARWTGSQYRNGPVYACRIVRPDGSVRYLVAQTNGRWCDQLDLQHARIALRSSRDRAGRVTFLDPEGQKLAENMYNWALHA